MFHYQRMSDFPGSDSLPEFSLSGAVVGSQVAYPNDAAICPRLARNSDFYHYRYQLEQDVQELQDHLQQEMELRALLESAIEKDVIGLSHYNSLPHTAQELLSHIADLEAMVARLEQEIISLRFKLSRERNERRLAEYYLKHSSSLSASCSLRYLKHLNSKTYKSLENISCQQPRDQSSEFTAESSSSSGSATENTADSVASFNKKDVLKETLPKLPSGIPPKGLWGNPNQLSEEMVRCMKSIFISLADSTTPSKASSPETSHLSPLSQFVRPSKASSWWSSSERSLISSWVQSPQIDIRNNLDILTAEKNVFDPYRVRGKLCWTEIGNYGLATEVSWMSVGKKQLEYASGELRRFSTLVEQLARVNPIHLSCNEKLAFWINVYNALIMHAYLAYGVPKSDLNLLSLMKKAAYTVGGHSYSAAAIEYVILKMRPPLYRPQIAMLLTILKLKVSEEQRKAASDVHEPLVAFALSCGMYSSPAVRIYTGKNLREELEEAQRDFIQASVGISTTGKLLVPKMLHCFAKNFVDDSNLALWVSHFLPPDQATFVEQCMLQRQRRSLLGSRNCGVLPFDSRFRYLFLPDKVTSVW